MQLFNFFHSFIPQIMKQKYFHPALLILLSIGISRAQTAADFETEIITSHAILSSSFISDETGWLGDDAGLLWKTTNGGESWSSISVEKNFNKLCFIDANIGYGIESGLLYKTTNGGTNWSTVSLPGGSAITLHFFNENTGLVSTNNAIYKTTNGGSSWTTNSTEGVSFVDLSFATSSIGIAAAYDDENECIWRTTDGGTTWTNVYNEVNYFINAVWFSSESVGWAAGYYLMAGAGKLPAINKTTDGGETWSNIFINENPGDIRGEQLLDIRFKNSLEGIAISTYSENMITSDGGETWNRTYNLESSIIPSHGIYNTLDGTSKMFLAGRKGYVTKWE